MYISLSFSMPNNLSTYYCSPHILWLVVYTSVIAVNFFLLWRPRQPMAKVITHVVIWFWSHECSLLECWFEYYCGQGRLDFNLTWQGLPVYCFHETSFKYTKTINLVILQCSHLSCVFFLSLKSTKLVENFIKLNYNYCFYPFIDLFIETM